MKQLTNATLFQFTESTSIFIGEFAGKTFNRTEDDPKDKNKKKGDLIGFHFTDGNGNDVLIGASATVEKIMLEGEEGEIKEGTIMGFKWLGKGKTKQGRDFNKYQIHAFDSFDEAEEFYHPESK